MKGLYYRLIIYLDTADESDTNYNIAWYMVHNLEKLSTIGISDLAKECYVSPATISRFCRTLGYDNFAHLKQDCSYIKQLKQRSQEITKIAVDSMKRTPVKASGDYIEQIILSLQNMQKELDWKAIDNVLRYIKEGKKVVFFGSQFSHSAALHLQADLLMLGKFTIAYIDYEKQIESAKHLDSDSVAIIITVNGNFVKTGSKAFHYIKKSKCKVAIITQQSDLEIAEFADEVIQLGDPQYGHVGKHTLLTLMELMSSRYHALFVHNK
ncbi:MAG: MurR/RpiR family transcriptional regulator [Beduini sp.]|uniref:MurR/RpiR family transcriptional regulator n=1 Tax=Beduini sp. TaxID=1922300 RepID=UPI0011C8B7D2